MIFIQSWDIYIGEPYSDQEQLPRLNYVDRDWYKGVTKTNDTYVSATFLSAAIHVPAIAVAVPVYGNTTGNNVNANQTALLVVGYWVGIINPAGIKDDLSRLDLLGQSNKILLIDHNETQVADLSSADNQNQSLKSYSQLQSVKNALNGKSGSALEMIDNVMTSVYYYPVYIHPHIGPYFCYNPLNDLIHLSCCIDCDSILYWNILCYLEQIFTIELTDTNRVRFYLKKSIDI